MMAARPVTTLDKSDVLSGLFAVWDAIDAQLEGLPETGWHAATPLPAWNVQAVVSHMIGTESFLSGVAPPEVDLSALPIRWQRFISHAVQPDPRRRLSDGAALVAALGVFGPVSPRSVTKYAPAVLAVVSLVVISSTVEWRRSTAAKLVAVAGGKATVANVLRPSISPPEVPPKQELVASTNPRAISRVVHVRSESASEGRVRQDPARRTVERSTHPLAPPSPASELLREVQFHRPAGGGADALPDPFLVDPFSVNHDRNSTR